MSNYEPKLKLYFPFNDEKTFYLHKSVPERKFIETYPSLRRFVTMQPLFIDDKPHKVLFVKTWSCIDYQKFRGCVLLEKLHLSIIKAILPYLVHLIWVFDTQFKTLILLIIPILISCTFLKSESCYRFFSASIKILLWWWWTQIYNFYYVQILFLSIF